MKADLSRATFDKARRYRSVRMQQGRVQLDADFNEQQDILNRRIEIETRDSLGPVAVPIGPGASQVRSSARGGVPLTMRSARVHGRSAARKGSSELAHSSQKASASVGGRPSATSRTTPRRRASA